MTKMLEIDDETYDRIEAYAAANNVDIPKYLKQLYLSSNVEKGLEKIQSIEYESVNVKVPKAVMDLLRYAQPVTGDTPEQDIEYYVVESVRSRLDADGFNPTAKNLTDQFSLNPVFKEILGDPIKE